MEEFKIKEIISSECFYEVSEKDDEGREKRRLFKTGEGEEGKTFFVRNKNTIEVRTDGRLGKLLCEKYESVMKSRYFGKNGIEIVLSGQLEKAEVEDLIRLSYNLSCK